MPRHQPDDVLRQPDSALRQWVSSIALAVVVSIAYFLAARLSLALLTKPDNVAVFWPASGVAAGVLIALGPSARLPVAIGAMAGTILAGLMDARFGMVVDTLFFALCNAAEALITAGLIELYFGSRFTLNSLRQVLGLLVAAIIGAAVSGIGGTLGFKYFYSSAAPVLTTWLHWFLSDALGILTVAPLLIGLASASREPPLQSELTEGLVGLVAIAVMSGVFIVLPQQAWATVVPIALLFPVLLWLAARCRPVFAAAAAFIVSSTIVWATTFGIGIFGGPGVPMTNRILVAQAGILAVSLCAFVLAALFAERKRNEVRLTRSNMMLERERNNKLMNLEAMVASISHEVRQPLTAIATNASAALRFLGHSPPDLKEVRSALSRMISDSHRTSQIFENIRLLFASTNRPQAPVDVNETALEILGVLKADLSDHGITVHVDLARDLPLISAHRGHLEEVFTNLFQNAIEAMDAIKVSRRMLQVRTKRQSDDTVVVEVEDSGPGIAAKDLSSIFDVFITTKSHGTGLGLAICRTAIERHGGQLTAFSDGKTGALFQIVLPIKPMDESATGANQDR